MSKVDNGPYWAEVVPFPGPQDPVADHGQDHVEAYTDDQDRRDDPPFVRVVARADVDSPIAGYESICHIHETEVMVARSKRILSVAFFVGCLFVGCLLQASSVAWLIG